MSKLKFKSLLVTGAPRSGSTFIGKSLSFNKNYVYVHEPFNFILSQTPTPFKYWFEHVSEINENQLIFDYLCKRLFYKREGLFVPFSDHIKDFTKIASSNFKYFSIKYLQKKPLMKDPIAFFSAEWLAKVFDMNVVITVRHPAAFIYSVIKKKWSLDDDFTSFIDQKLLLNKYLGEFEVEIMEVIQKKKDIIDRAALLWKIIYYVANDYRTRHPDWIFVRHEDFASEPVERFKELYNKLSLTFSPRNKKEISNLTGSNNPKESENFDKRDSLQTTIDWKNNFTKEEVLRIRKSVEEVSRLFYSDKDWNI